MGSSYGENFLKGARTPGFVSLGLLIVVLLVIFNISTILSEGSAADAGSIIMLVLAAWVAGIALYVSAGVTIVSGFAHAGGVWHAMAAALVYGTMPALIQLPQYQY